MRRLKLLLLAALLNSTPAFSRPAGPFIDVTEYAARPGAEFDVRTYEDQLKSLKRQFEFICGDTFCEGEFSNLVSMDFNCSIQKNGPGIGDCVWSFAGSYAKVKPVDGSVRVNARFYHCHIPFDGDVGQLKDFMVKASNEGSGYVGLHDTIVPGSTGVTLMDVLGACF